MISALLVIILNSSPLGVTWDLSRFKRLRERMWRDLDARLTNMRDSCNQWRQHVINSSLPGQNGRYFADDIFRCIFVNENVWISIKISLNFVPGGPINNIPSLVQIMAWRRPGDKPLSEPMMISLLTHIWATQSIMPLWWWWIFAIKDNTLKPVMGFIYCNPRDKSLYFHKYAN